MANSTAYVLSAGGLVFANKLIVQKDVTTSVRVGVATVAAAVATAGIDKLFPGMGVGLGVIMVAVAILTNGVPFLEFITGQKLGPTS